MKKKLVLILIPFTLSALLFAGCGSGRPSSDTPAVQEDSDSSESSLKPEPSPEDTSVDSGNEPIDEAFTQEQDDPFTLEELDIAEFSDMEKALAALMRCSLDGNTEYDGQNPDFFWSALYQGVVNYTKDIPLAETIDGEIRVPRMAVQEFATGLFADYSDLLPLPENSTTIRYDEAWDAYIFTPMASGEPLTCRMLYALQNSDGSVMAAAALYNDKNVPVYCCIFTLSSNAYADGIEAPMFLRSVYSMAVSDAVASTSQQSTLIGNFQGFSDGHTAEFLIDGNLVAFQVRSMEIKGILMQAAENEQLTIAVETDEATESRTITSIIGK